MPGSTYHVVDALITNFHVPRSTLMMLVSALATREQIMAAYQAAIDEKVPFPLVWRRYAHQVALTNARWRPHDGAATAATRLQIPCP